MTLRLYDTYTKKLKEFEPIEKGEVKLYHCGPTVYWSQHIGNLRGMFCADLVVRTFKYFGYEVTHVRNYTDVGHLTSDGDEGEDKMEKGVRREGLSPDKIAQKYIDIFENDTKELNLLEPTFKPRVTAHINEIVEMVQTLIDKNYAYTTDLAIYFDISKAKDYTKLSGQIIEENMHHAGKSDVSDQQKKHPSDFALWFFKAGTHKNALQFWQSPFVSPLVENGNGFPGWHIECSAMSKKYLGNTLDVHMGGIEHISVHHTNEIAQSESANGTKFTNYWLHNEHLLANNKKMAKSEGTTYSLQELKEKGYNPLSLRYLFLTAHYKSKLNFTWKSLEASQNALNKIYEFIKSAKDDDGEIIQEYENRFKEALENNLDTPRALAVTWEMIKAKNYSAADKKTTLLKFDSVFGLGLNYLEEETIPEEVKSLLNKRNGARDKKDWKLSDDLRNEIEKAGFTIKDTERRTEIRKK